MKEKEKQQRRMIYCGLLRLFHELNGTTMTTLDEFDKFVREELTRSIELTKKNLGL